jgi:hypothetical protein
MISMCDLHFLQILNQVMQIVNQIMGKKIHFHYNFLKWIM